MSAKEEGHGDTSFFQVIQLNPLYAIVTRTNAAFVNIGSFKTSADCSKVYLRNQPNADIIEAGRIGAKPNVMYYLTTDGIVEFLTMRNGICFNQGRVRINEPLAKPLLIQMGLYMLIWPDKTKNRFHMFDLKRILGSPRRGFQ